MKKLSKKERKEKIIRRKNFAAKALWIWTVIVSVLLVGIGIALDIWSRVLYTAVPLAQRTMTPQMWILSGVGAGLLILGIVGILSYIWFNKKSCKCKGQNNDRTKN